MKKQKQCIGGLKKLHKLAIYFGFCRERFRKRHGTAYLRSSEASIAFLFVALQLWREMCPTAIDQVGPYASHFAGFLPTVCRLPAVALALYFN